MGGELQWGGPSLLAYRKANKETGSLGRFWAMRPHKESKLSMKTSQSDGAVCFIILSFWNIYQFILDCETTIRHYVTVGLRVYRRLLLW